MANNTPIIFSVISEEELKHMIEYINAIIPDITQIRSSPIKIINLVIDLIIKISKIHQYKAPYKNTLN